MGRILEGFWDCKYCDTKRIGGSKRECPNCGKARGDDTKFYLDTTEGRYVPEDQAARINRNPDWVCDFCNQLNSDNNDVCISCGAPRETTSLNYFENHAKRNEDSHESKKIDSDDDEADASGRYHSSSYVFDEPGKSTWQKGLDSVKNFFSSHWRAMLIALLVVVSIVGIVCLLIPKELEVTIQEFSWSRTIEIQKYQTVQESDWSLPSDARLLYSQPELSHYQDVFDHYETKTRQVAKQRISHYETYVSGYRDLRNRYFEEITSERPVYETYYETETYQEAVYRSEPVYRTKYYYEIDKWLYERSVKTSASDKSPYWGDPGLSSDERASSKTETYTITGIDSDDKERSIHLSFEDWSSLEIGQTVKVKVSIGGYGELIEIINK